MKIVIYGTADCKWCDRAKELVTGLNLDYDYVDVAESEEAQTMFREQGLRTVPQVFDSNTRIGGYEALKAHFANPS